MKKVFKGIAFGILGLGLLFGISILAETITNKIDPNDSAQHSLYFPEGEERYVLVDEAWQNIGDTKYLCKVFADKYMGTMYLQMWDKSHGSYCMTQIFYEDGSPMIYDSDNLWEE